MLFSNRSSTDNKKGQYCASHMVKSIYTCNGTPKQMCGMTTWAAKWRMRSSWLPHSATITGRLYSNDMHTCELPSARFSCIVYYDCFYEPFKEDISCALLSILQFVDIWWVVVVVSCIRATPTTKDKSGASSSIHRSKYGIIYFVVHDKLTCEDT